ncbi:hypothetical protein [Oscillibacter sp.]|uniref:hypothetical protein n=1 Tax=Oscillibacter sp. TaxID=1945593 RepID=UPI002D805146|nr:hypothetical protein [Oscillibacter sp.]
MTRLKAHWKPLAVVLSLVLWAAWYSRPVDIYGLAPKTREPDMMDFVLSDLGENRKDYPIKNITPEDPEWDAALEAIESLRFRRPPWNAVLQFIPGGSTHGRVTHDGDLHIMFYLGRRTKGYIQVQFFIDEWMYHSPHSNRNLTLWVEDSRQAGETLAAAFRPLLEDG